MATRDSANLVHDLMAILGKDNVYILNALTPNTIGCTLDDICITSMHPKITCVEFAVARSHEAARQFSYEKSARVSIILEDDASLESNFPILVELFRKRCGKSATPIGLHCYPEQFGILTARKNSEFLRCLRVPDYAITYILNLAALQELSQTRDRREPEIADWPKYMRKILWLAPNESMVAHQELFSFVDPSRKVRQDIEKGFLISRKLNAALMLFVFHAIGLLGKRYGKSKIASEKLRSYVIGGSHVIKASDDSR